MLEQQRHLRKLNGHKSPSVPVMARHLASQWVAYLWQHVQALHQTDEPRHHATTVGNGGGP